MTDEAKKKEPRDQATAPLSSSIASQKGDATPLSDKGGAALAYLQVGYCPIPVNDKKAPVIPSWQQYQSRRPTEDEIRRWWQQHPDANIALVSGHGGVVMLDIDVKANPKNKEVAEKIAAAMSDKTVVVRTPSGGYHMYFKETDATSAAAMLGTFGEFRAGGLYVLAPPSTGYEFVGDARQPMAVADAWGYVSDYLRQFDIEIEQLRTKATRQDILSEPIREGERNNILTSVAGSLRSRGADYEITLTALLAVNQTQFQPPLDEQEVRVIARSVSRYKTGEQNQTSNYTPEPLEVRLQREVSAADLQRRAEHGDIQVPYLTSLGIDGFFVKGWSHILAAYPKTGKTELMVSLCHQWCLQGETVLYFSEEPEGIWHIRLRRYPSYWQGMTVIMALGMPPEDIEKRIEEGKESVVIVDTTRNLLRLENENDNSEVTRKLLPIIKAARGGNPKTPIFLHHTRKTGGEYGRAIAGAHAFLGIVDIALELDRDPHAPKSNRRYLHGQGRINEVPELVYERKADGKLEALGNPEDLEFENVRTRVFDLVKDEWQVTKEIHEQMEDDSQPSQEQVRKALINLANKKKIERDPPIDEKAKGKTHKWRLPNLTSNEPPSKLEVKPTEPCPACKQNKWWQLPEEADGTWNCGVCHPQKQ